MSLEELSRRVGLVVGLGALAACSKAKEPTIRDDVPPLGSAPTPVASTVPSTAPSTSASATVPLAEVQDAGLGPGFPPASPHPFGHGCGSHVVCNPAPAKAPAVHAAAPFERCATTLPANDALAQGPGTFDLERSKDASSKKATCCYSAPVKFCGGGRPLPAGDGSRVAPVVARGDYRLDDADLAAPCPRDLAIAARHLRDAASEHASVASFARVSLVLVALGAPPALLSEVHVAALDEIRHARIFCALAARRGVPAMGPGPLSLEGVTLAVDVASFVHETVRDGCLAEARALLDLEARADDGDPIEKMCFARIAEDETRHVELSWKMLAWVVEAYGDVAREALEDALVCLESDSDTLVRTLVVPCAMALLDGRSRVSPAHAVA